MIDMSLRPDAVSPLSANFDARIHITTAPGASGTTTASAAATAAAPSAMDAPVESSGDAKNKKRKRASHELKAETIPLNDARRSYPRIFSTMMNRCQSEDIALRLASIADPNHFVFVLHCKDAHDSVCPRYRELKGIDCTARFFGVFFQTTPDSIFVMKDYLFFKRSTSSQIHCNFELTGSIIYQMVVQNATCVVQCNSAQTERATDEEDPLEAGEGSTTSRAESPADLERETGEESDTTPSGSVGGILASEECESAESCLVKEEKAATAKIVGLDALAHVAEMLFTNQEDKLRHSTAATSSAADSTTTTATSATSATTTSSFTSSTATTAAAAATAAGAATTVVMPSRDSATDLQGKKTKKVATEAPEKDKEGLGAAAEKSSPTHSSPSATVVKQNLAAQRGGAVTAAGTGSAVRKEKRAIIGATILTNCKITMEGSAVATEGSSSSYPVVNTAITSSRLYADKGTTFALGDKVNEANGHNFTCAGQVIFYVNPSKRVERMELLYHIDHSAPNVMSKPLPAMGLVSLPSVASNSGNANLSSAAQYSPSLNASLGISPISSTLASSNSSANLANVISMLAHREESIKEEKV